MRSSRIAAVIILASIAFAGSTPALSAPILWSSAAGGNDHWYEFVRNEGINWDTANSAATGSTHLGMTGHLVTLTSQAENDFVWSLVDFKPNSTTNKGSIWLGGVQPAGSAEPSGGWGWVTGEAWVYTNWAAVEPNDTLGLEQHLTFDDFTMKGGTWNDWAGTNGGSGYVIEYSARVPEPGALALVSIGLVGFVAARRRRRT